MLFRYRAHNAATKSSKGEVCTVDRPDLPAAKVFIDQMNETGRVMETPANRWNFELLPIDRQFNREAQQ